MNKYKNPNSTTIGTTGCMYNESTTTNEDVEYNHYGIYSNDNTYAVTFNPHINRPPTKNMPHYPVRPPPTDEHMTLTQNEPPVSMTDGMHYLNNATTLPPPLLPPYLNKPQDLAAIQGLANERDKANLIYTKPANISFKNIHY